MVVAHNLYAENVQRQYRFVNLNKKESDGKPSGDRTNRMADDAAILELSGRSYEQLQELDRAAEEDNDCQGQATVEVVEDPNGAYVKGATGAYVKYDASAHLGQQRYSIRVSHGSSQTADTPQRGMTAYAINSIPITINPAGDVSSNPGLADEMVSSSTTNILEQAGQSMLSQANLQAQDVLSLLE